MNLLPLLLTAANVTAPPLENDWAQWRGPRRDGTVQGATWPESLDEDHLALQWRVELGESYASPIVTETRVFTVETRDKRDEIARAFDRKTGEQLWETSWTGAMKVPFFAARNGSWVRSTPAYADGVLYVCGMRDVLVALDGASGEVLWRVDFTERYGTGLPDFGLVCSPLVVGEHLYVQAGNGLCKLSCKTGESVWRTLDGGESMMSSGAFSSPVFATLQDTEQIVLATREELAAVAPDTGAVLWRQPIKSFRGMNILTPLVHGDAVFTSAHSGRGQLIEIGSGDEGALTATKSWENRAIGYMTSPVVVDEHVYLFLQSNRFSCSRLSDGEVCWISEPTGNAYWSLTTQGDRILALTDEGELLLIRANPEKLEILDRRELTEDETWAHIAPAGEQLFVRELGALAAWSWKAK